LDDNDLLLSGRRPRPSHGRGASAPVQIVVVFCRRCSNSVSGMKCRVLWG
jgi:hypothetical protein